MARVPSASHEARTECSPLTPKSRYHGRFFEARIQKTVHIVEDNFVGLNLELRDAGLIILAVSGEGGVAGSLQRAEADIHFLQSDGVLLEHYVGRGELYWG